MLIVVKTFGTTYPAASEGALLANKTLLHKLITELMSYRNQEKVQAEIDQLSRKRRKDRTERDKVRLLQLKLYDKAKRETGFRFYVLYDKIFQPHTLSVAYQKVKAIGGSPGLDNQSFAEIEAYGRDRFLNELGESLRKGTYRPSAVKRVWIEKPNGGQRPLGIPTIRDRVAQAACKLVIEPIFEADFIDSSYGFRPKRSAQGAIEEVKINLLKGYTEVYDVDLSKYFDMINHRKLEIALSERITDPRVLRLIRLWLKSPIAEPDGTYSGGKKSKVGTPQGGVISPLLANIYLNLLDRIITRKGGRFEQACLRMVRYADDMVLMAPQMESWMLEAVEGLLTRMELKINKDKTRVVNARKGTFTFLGFRISYERDRHGRNRKYWYIRASEKSLTRLRQKINTRLKRIGHYPPEAVVAELNPILRGWVNYYRIPGVSLHRQDARKMHFYLTFRLNRYYQRKSQRKSRLFGQGAYNKLVQKYGLINMATV